MKELARGDFAIPALGKLLKDRSFLEQFATGKRGPKLGDLRAFRWGRVGKNPVFAPQVSWIGTESVIPAMKQSGFDIRAGGNRQEARNHIAKMLRTGRAGGDVYEHIGRFFSVKLRLRELARGDYAIPALGKMLKDRSFLEQFLTGKRGPKMGDLSVGKIYPGGMISARRPPKKSDFQIAGWTKGQMLGTEPVGPQNARWRDALIEERIRGRKENFKKNRSSLSDVARNVPFPLGLTAEEAAWAQSARTAARNNAAKMLRKGRAGGDVYEDIDRKFFAVDRTPFGE
jgi:hypothetical protein